MRKKISNNSEKIERKKIREKMLGWNSHSIIGEIKRRKRLNAYVEEMHSNKAKKNNSFT